MDNKNQYCACTNINGENTLIKCFALTDDEARETFAKEYGEDWANVEPYGCFVLRDNFDSLADFDYAYCYLESEWEEQQRQEELDMLRAQQWAEYEQECYREYAW